MKRLRVLVLVHPDLIPPDSSKGFSEQEINVWKTEYDVVNTLRAAGHEVRPLGVHDELKPIRDDIEAWKPDVVFTLLEQFHGEAIYDQNVVSYLELLRVPYTGCNPRGLMLARGKDLSKTLVQYHRVPVPDFAVFPMRRKVKRPSRLALPLIVKSINEDASYGISQASVVDSDEKLVERVNFIHERIGTAAIAEQYIEGREIYVGIVGNERLLVLPVWELQFKNMPQGDWLIATEKVKHDPDYQERRGILHGPAKDLAPELALHIQRLAKRIIGHLSSTAMPGSISALQLTAHRIFWKPIRILKSPKARNSPPPHVMSASAIRIYCTGSWRLACGAAQRPRWRPKAK